MKQFFKNLGSLIPLFIPLFILVVVGVMEHFGWKGEVHPKVVALGDWGLEMAEKIKN